MAEGERRRRRTRRMSDDASGAQGPPPDGARNPGGAKPAPFVTMTSETYEESVGHLPIADLADAGQEDRDERSLRGLIGSGSSQVNVRAALRARDASRPRADDIVAAEAGLKVVHRGWAPRDA